MFGLAADILIGRFVQNEKGVGACLIKIVFSEILNTGTSFIVMTVVASVVYQLFDGCVAVSRLVSLFKFDSDEEVLQLVAEEDEHDDLRDVVDEDKDRP